MSRPWDKPDVDADIPLNYDAAFRQWQKRYVIALLRRTDGDTKRAAELAGLSRGGLYAMLYRAGLHLRRVHTIVDGQSPLRGKARPPTERTGA